MPSVVPFTGLSGEAAAGTIGVGVPDAYQRITADPNAFGAGIGRATQQLGGATQQAGETAFGIQAQFDQTAAANAFSQLRDRATSTSWGDPTNPQAAPGLLTLAGDQAMHAYQPAVDGLKKSQSDIAATLSPQAARTFNLQAQRFLGDTFSGFDQHRAVAQKQWEVGSLDAQADSASSAAIANAGDQTTFLHNLADTRNAIISKGDKLGWSPEATTQQLAERTSSIYSGVTKRLATVNPQTALQYYQQNQDRFTGTDALALEAHLRPAVMSWGARDAEQGLFAQYGGASGGYLAPSPPGSIQPIAPADRAGMLNTATAGTSVPPQLLGALVQQESGWDAGRTGKGGDIGLGQVLASTAASPGFGLPSVNPAVLRSDPAANLAFACRYLEARGKAAGCVTPADWQDPNKVAAALTSYNGGGDRNYAANVLRYVPPGGLGGAAHPSTPNAIVGVNPLAIGDGIAQGAANANGFSGGGMAGADPDQVLASINARQPGSIPSGTPVVLSTGLSGDPSKLDVVQQQIASLHARGATDIRLLGVGNRPDLAPLNGQLADIAKSTGATFLGPIQAGADGVHPATYTGVGLPTGAAAGSGVVTPPPAGDPRPNFPAMMDAASRARDPFGQDNPVFQEQLMSRLRSRERLMEYGQQEAARAGRDMLTTALLGLPTAPGVAPSVAPSALPAPASPMAPAAAGGPPAAGGAQPAQQAQLTPPPVFARHLPTTLDELLTTPQLVGAWNAATPEMQKSVLTTLDHNGTAGVGKDVHTYGDGFLSAFNRVHLPDGDPNRLTDPAQLLPLLGQQQNGVTVAGLDKLRGEIQGRGTPETEADSALRSGFFKSARASISGADDGLGLKDPKGDALMLKFMAQTYPLIAAGKAKGLSAAQLYNPDDPNYVGASIPSFKRTLAQRVADMTAGNAGQDGDAQPEPPAQPGFFARMFGATPPPPDLTTPAGIRDAVTSGKMSRDEGIQRLTGSFKQPPARVPTTDDGPPTPASPTPPPPSRRSSLPYAGSE